MVRWWLLVVVVVGDGSSETMRGLREGVSLRALLKRGATPAHVSLVLSLMHVLLFGLTRAIHYRFEDTERSLLSPNKHEHHCVEFNLNSASRFHITPGDASRSISIISVNVDLESGSHRIPSELLNDGHIVRVYQDGFMHPYLDKCLPLHIAQTSGSVFIYKAVASCSSNLPQQLRNLRIHILALEVANLSSLKKRFVTWRASSL